MSALARIALTPCGRSMLTRMNVPLAARAMQTSAGSYQTFCFFFLKGTRNFKRSHSYSGISRLHIYH